MGVTGLRWCDFVLWSPWEVSVERISFDEKLWDMLKKLIVITWTSFFFSNRMKLLGLSLPS